MDFTLIIYIIIFLVAGGFTLLFFWIGIHNERSHLTQLDQEEKALEHIMVVNNLKCYQGDFASAQLVTGESAIATDKFKQFCAQLRAIFGGEVKSLTTQVMRTRRQALLNLKKEASTLGATLIVNVRYEGIGIRTENEKKKENPHGTFALAYGTALIPKQN